MCTSIALTDNGFFFGRNMDIEFNFGERIVVTPRACPLRFRRTDVMNAHYAMVGMATVADGYPLYAEAGNEKGLCMAGLNFPGNAYYPDGDAEEQANIAPFELIPWVLGQCATVREARILLERTHLTRINFSESLPLTPLHWHIADRNESIVLESMRDGMHIHTNPVGVVTNNPPFDFHLTNLRQYLNLTTAYPVNRFHPEAQLTPFGVGMGSLGLPGDFSPASRFVRAVFLKLNSYSDGSAASSISRFFHLLDAVAMPDGIVETEKGPCEKTAYSCCFHAEAGIYYCKNYTNNQLTAVNMRKENLDGCALREFEMIREQQVCLLN